MSTPDLEPKIRIKNVSRIFGRSARRALRQLDAGVGKKEVQEETGVVVGVHDVSLDIYPGEIFVIMGLSGSGKSTLLRLINRLLEPSAGRIEVDGVDVTAMGRRQLRQLRRAKFGMVFQSFALLPHRTVLGNVAFGLEIQGVGRAEREARALQVIETVGLSGYEHRHASELSGGMQQRVGLARALAADPEILLMDEAFSALDPLIRSQLQDDLLEIQSRIGKTIVFVSHDLDEAIKIGSRIAILRDGRLIQVGTAQDILANPADAYVSAFVEGADRTRVLSAEQIMQPLRVAAKPGDSARVVLRKMERSGFGGLLVVDNARHLLGFVRLADVTAQRDRAQLDASTFQPLPTVTAETTLSDVIQRIHAEGSPVAVVDARQRVVGVVDKSTVLAALAQGDGNSAPATEAPPAEAAPPAAEASPADASPAAEASPTADASPATDAAGPSAAAART